MKNILQIIIRPFFYYFNVSSKVFNYIIRYIEVFSMPDNDADIGPYLKKAFSAVLSARINRGINKHYALGAILGALQAQCCGYKKITLIEFGVAKGDGLRSLMKVSEIIRQKMGIDVRVVGFDNRTGLPEPKDFRDHPEIWSSSQFAMSQSYEILDLEVKKNDGDLIIGDIAQTLSTFNMEDRVLAFASIDVDYYSSTKPITEWLKNVDSSFLLPASVLYFDDIISMWTYSKFAGESLAIQEFNNESMSRKIELKYPSVKLFALHDFENVYRTGESSPLVKLVLFAHDLDRFY
tara:strand:- start:597 stop:1475 length:879 start_codon:yes stop_codon:yes gene_type:complete